MRYPTTINQMKHISNLAEEVINHKRNVVLTGFQFLDEAIGGYHGGELTTIIGNENSGKTAFLISQMAYIAIDNHTPALFVIDDNLSDDEFFLSLFAYYYSIKTNDILSLLDDEENRYLLHEFSETLLRSSLYIMHWNYDERKDAFRNLEETIAEKGIQIVLFDECFCMPQMRDHEFSLRLKHIAIKHDIPIVTAYQTWYQNREHSDTALPTLHDFSDFSQFKSDVVIAFVDYEDVHITTDEVGHNLHGKLGLQILKQKGLSQTSMFVIDKSSLYFRRKIEGLQCYSYEELEELSQEVVKVPF